MNANREEIVAEGNATSGKSTRTARKLAQLAIHFGRRMSSGPLALGLIALLNLIPAGRVTAQTFTPLHSFTASHTNSSGFYTNSDGANPHAGLIVSGNTLYGMAEGGGSSGAGTLFAVNTDGTGFTNLHSFNHSEGANPGCELILSGHSMYGTTANGGSSGYGTIFAINTDGTGFTNLHAFTQFFSSICDDDSDCPPGTTCFTESQFRKYCRPTNIGAVRYDGAYPNSGLIL